MRGLFMKKYFLTSLVALGCILLSSCQISGGNNNDPNHTHTFSSEWKYDEKMHWHESTCGHNVTSGNDNHSFSEWRDYSYDSSDNETTKMRFCTICSYVQYEGSKKDDDGKHDDDGDGDVDFNKYGYDASKYLKYYRNNFEESIYIDREALSGDYYLIIPSKIDNLTVREISSYSFYNLTGLRAIFIPDTIEHIEPGSFYGCNNLEVVKIDSNNKFYNSNNNANAIIETETNTLIVGFKTTKIPNGVKSIGYKAFAYLETLKSIDIPSSVETIEDNAFNNCINLEKVNFNEGLKSIGDNSFYLCESLASINLPETLNSIGDNCFSACYCIDSIHIPANLTVIGVGAFETISEVNSITVDKDNLAYTSLNNSNVIVESETGKLILGCKNSVITKDVVRIGNSAFYGAKGLELIEIPNSVESIDSYAFYGCSDLKSIVIPASVTNIGDKVFGNCSSLISISVDQNNTEYDSRNNSNAIIETETNKMISACNSTIIPNDVVEIGEYAFLGMSKLKAIDIPGNIQTINAHAFDSCSSLESIVIPEGTTEIGAGAFKYCTSLKSFSMPQSCESIYSGMLAYCENLTSIKIYGQGNNYYVDEDTNSIIYISKSFLGTYYDLYQGCNTTIMPNKIKIGSIIGSAFMGMKNLTNIIIPEGVTTIRDKAFADCTNLSWIVIPSSISSLYSSAFDYYKPNLTIYFKGAPNKWKNNSYISSEGYKDVLYYSEEKPTDTDYKYWRFVDGVPKAWAY